jgi:exodeoxyribonuclease VII large subunit
MAETGQPLSLFELNHTIREAIAGSFTENYWVVAEIIEFRENSNGHCYLELVEKKPDNMQIMARAKAMIWSYTWRMLKPFFEATTRQQLAAGMKVLIQVTVEFHEQFGLSLHIRDIDPSYTLGDLEKKRREILKKLEEEGVIAMNRELDFPRLPQKIAIISSETAAGYGDFMDSLVNNPAGYHFYTKLFPAVMQGDGAESSVIEALDHIYRYHHFFDLVVIIRGGGSKADLHCFDSYWLAYHITQFPLPVVTGIGHERDETIADLVAHTRMKTPTAVASFLLERMTEAEEFLDEAASVVSSYAETNITEQLRRLDGSVIRFSPVVRNLLEHQNSHLNLYRKTLQYGSGKLISETRYKQESKWIQLSQSGRKALDIHGFRLMKNEDNLGKAIPSFLKNREQQLLLYENTCKHVDPKLILSKGYSITRIQGKIVKSVSLVQPGQQIETILKDGKIISTTNEIAPDQ